MSSTKVIHTVITVLSFAIGLVGLILGLIIMTGNTSLIDAGLYVVYITLIASAVIAILFGIFQFVTHIRENLSLLIGIVGFVIVAFIAYSVTHGQQVVSNDNVITASISHLSGAGLVMLYILLIVTAGAAITGELVRLFK